MKTIQCVEKKQGNDDENDDWYLNDNNLQVLKIFLSYSDLVPSSGNSECFASDNSDFAGDLERSGDLQL